MRKIVKLNKQDRCAFCGVSQQAYRDVAQALKLHKQFWDRMPKGQLGKISCDVGLLNDAFLATNKALAHAQEVA